MAERPILVKATHSYSPANNDELKLEKGEILTVTRKEEGGWFEGTLSNGKTGWFPSNYVEDVVLQSSPSAPSLSNGSGGVIKSSIEIESTQNLFTDSVAFAAQQAEYRKVAFTELMESEATHLSELQLFWENYMIPLQKSDLLTPGEFKIMVGNFSEIMQVHLNSILNLLKVEQNKPAKEQKVGSIFLENAPKFEEVHKTYCSNHPKAIQVVEKHKEELGCFIEGKGGRKPGILLLITALSQPFRRLEKYSTSLQEIERYVEEFHVDRGDLQRSIEYYKDIQKNCSALRKQKEMELEVLSGAIKDWEGADVSQLGEIIFMNLVYLGYERQPRYFVLFSNTLLILSYNTENNSLVYEGKVPVSGITLRPLDNLTNAFEIAGPMIDQITVGCSSKAIRDTWLGHLNSILKSNRFPSFSSSPQQSFGQLTPLEPLNWNIARLRAAPPFNPFLSEYLTGLKKLRQSQRQDGSSTTSLNIQNQNLMKNGVGNRATGGGASSTASIMSFRSSYNHTPTVTNEDDFAVLSIVDSFCTKNRHTVTSNNMSPHTNKTGLIISSQQIKPPPRTLAQLVMQLREEMLVMKKSMEEEQRKRVALQILVQKSLTNNGHQSTSSCSNGNGPSSSILSLSSTPDP